MFLGLRTALYAVAAADMDGAKAWYAEVLGVQPNFDQPYYVGFSVGGFELGLVPDDSAPGRHGPQALWGVTDAVAAHVRLIALGATSLGPVKDVGEGIKVGAVMDPFGNGLGFIENPHFKMSH